PGIELRNLHQSGMPTPSREAEGKSGRVVKRDTAASRGVRGPGHARRHLTRKPGDPRADPGRSPGPHREPERGDAVMDGHGKSDRPVVPRKSANTGGEGNPVS